MMKTNNNLSFIDAKQIQIVDYLADLAIEPVKIYGNDRWYYSPFREERTPSFKVNIKLNLWYDHGTGEGGTILDLGARLHQCTLYEFLEKLSQADPSTVSLHRKLLPVEKPESRLEIVSTQTLTSPDLIHYLKSRCIDIGTANKYCREIDFSIGSKTYTAIGFPNQSNAYELRNRWFKGSSSPKDFSFIDNGEKKICVMEGFMDFLSALSFDGRGIKELTVNSNFLVLNSLRLLKRGLPILQSYKEVNLFLDNDIAAKEAKENLREKGVSFNDASSLYHGHKDVNEYLIASSKTNHGQTIPRTRSRGMRR
jgi:hypothetical protein